MHIRFSISFGSFKFDQTIKYLNFHVLTSAHVELGTKSRLVDKMKLLKSFNINVITDYCLRYCANAKNGTKIRYTF